MRLDRTLTLRLFHPAQCWTAAARRRALPILMYHSISDDLEPAASAYYKTATGPEIFRQHMRHLVEQGYRPIDLSSAAEWLRHGGSLDEKTVVITFDDGFRNFYTEAFPVLQTHGFTATVFLPTAFIRDDRCSFKGTECLTWNEVRELRKGGMSFGSHTMNHFRLVDLPWNEIRREVHDSRTEMEQQLRERITTFAYPFAFPQNQKQFTKSFCNLLAETGYTCCATTELGRVQLGDDPYRLKRLPINSLDDIALFRAKLEGGYDWMALPQALVKKCKRPHVLNTQKNIHSQTATISST